jgi:phospholipase D1/2
MGGEPGPSITTAVGSNRISATGTTPKATTPREASPDVLTPFSTASKSSIVGKKPYGSGASLVRSATIDGPSGGKELADAESPVHGSGTPVAGRKSVQFSRDTEEISPQSNGSPDPGDASEQEKPHSLYARLRALAIPQGYSFTHTRSPSTLSASARSIDGKDTDPTATAPPARAEAGLAATLEEDSGAEADADGDESSAAENYISQPASRKRRRRFQRFDNIETAPSSPHSVMRTPYVSAPMSSDAERPATLARRATDTDMPSANQGVSEDEGRRQIFRDTGWKPRHPLRGLSYGGAQRKTGEITPEGSQRRPLTLLNFANIGSSREGAGSAEQTPKTPSRRKMLAERSTTLGAAKWSQLKQSIRTLGQRKKKLPTPENQRSAALMAELAAGAPAALMLASMFQRDEHNQKRVPILLEQLRVRVVDSEVDQSKTKDDKPLKGTDDDKFLRHLIFKIECEYGNGANRMRWVIKRSLGDFSKLHVKYKGAYNAGRLRLRSDGRKKLPHFPLEVFPYLKGLRLFGDEPEDQGDVDAGDETEPGTATDTDRPALQARTPTTLGRRKSSLAGLPDALPGTTRRDAFAERQRRSLEKYLRDMIQFLLFRPESNRLCRFLEISALGMRLAAEGSEHGKEGLLLIRSAKGLDFRALNAVEFKKRHSPKWFLVRHSYVVCVDSAEQMHIYDVFLFDSDFKIQPRKFRSAEQRSTKELASIAKETAKHPQHHRLKLVNSERKLKLISDNERQLQQFEDSIRDMVAASPWSKVNRFDSFAPIRPNCFAQWLVDGRDHMWVVSRALNQAKDVIYIHDWWLSPELYMRRPPAISQKWRLDRLLKRKAEEGVKVFVIVYRNIDAAIPIDSQYTKFSLLDLHPNVFVQRSPNQFRQNTFFWAHHEKICIVDHTVAFVGGIDLCFGRWDTPQHTLIDDKVTGFEPNEEQPKDADHCQLWPGKDYSNPRIQDFYALNKPYEEMYDRQRVARMPWHDISMQVVGQPARDLTRHFVQRWNYILRQRKPTRPTPFLLPPPDFNPADLEALGLDGTCEVQIVRSAGPWSLGTPDKTEHSIMNAYIKMIEESEHFVYMENQFFISSCETESTVVHNQIGDALVERITRASKNDEAWKAVVVIPLIPGFQNTVEEEGGTSVRLIMQYQYRSICRGESSIFGRLKAAGIDPEDYIQFYALRQWGRIGPRKTLVTEQLYIHAKCMVVDDRVAIIGSANINERSMLGNRDSECAAVVRDTDMVWSKMNGVPYQVGRFPHTLRMRLMREHLGLDVDKIMEDAQVMETEHQKAQGAAANSARSPASEEIFTSPMSEAEDVLGPLDGQGADKHEEMLERAEEFRSFNHDVDWEQEGNPNLKSKRAGITHDPRVTGDHHHKDDVEGFGYDNMAAINAIGLGDGRDTTIVKGNKEVLVSDFDPEGKATMREPRKHGEQIRMPSYVAKLEAPNPPLPPKPGLERVSTFQLGLPMLSQLPPLPELDDSDIGGPSLTKTASKDSTRARHPLMDELRRPLIDRDCMTDPIDDAFFVDTWHAVAENNTKIYRSVFRCMPDNQVRNWEEYHQYLAYEQRFNQLQGNDLPTEDKVTNPSGGESKSGPPGVGSRTAATELKAVTHVPTDIEKRASELKGKLKNAVGDKSSDEKEDPEKEKLRVWAAEANRAQAEREGKPTLHRQETLTAEKSGLATVHEGQTITEEGSATGEDDEASTDPPNSSPASTAVERERPTANGKNPGSNLFPGLSDATTQNSTAAPNSTTNVGGSGRRRRRATTRSSRRDFSASDDLLSLEEAEDLLGCVQGHLVVWPYDW